MSHVCDDFAQESVIFSPLFQVLTHTGDLDHKTKGSEMPSMLWAAFLCAPGFPSVGRRHPTSLCAIRRQSAFPWKMLFPGGEGWGKRNTKEHWESMNPADTGSAWFDRKKTKQNQKTNFLPMPGKGFWLSEGRMHKPARARCHAVAPCTPLGCSCALQEPFLSLGDLGCCWKPTL